VFAMVPKEDIVRCGNWGKIVLDAGVEMGKELGDIVRGRWLC
jgi:hypothetical protein